MTIGPIKLTRVPENKIIPDVVGVLRNNFNLISNILLKPLTLNYTPVTADYDVQGDDEVILGDATDASFEITLPPAIDYIRRVLIIKRTDAVGGNQIDVTPFDTENIEGVNAPISLTGTSRTALTLFSDGTEWWTIN